MTGASRRPRTARGVALDALVAVDAGARANVVATELLAGAGLDQRDRALVTQLVYGTVRMRRACDWMVDRHVRGRTDTDVRAALRLGAYQLGWLRIPRHAAVAATVAEVRGPGRALVNAVLRRVADDVERGPLAWPDPATALSYPDWIVARLAAELGPARTRAALEAMNEPAVVHERPDGYIQDPASQMVATYVGAGAGERILDLCAAPGGKATALAGGEATAQAGAGLTASAGARPTALTAPAGTRPSARGARPGLVVAADVDAGRTRVVAANAARLGLDNVATVVADGRRPAWRAGTFDRVLVDAPCSGLGVLRRRPDARWRVRPGDVIRLATLQRELLAAAVSLCAPGGVVVYSVCTLTRAETLEVDRWAAGAWPALAALAPPGPPWEPLGRGGLLLPQAAGTDGMYVLALRAPVAATPGAGR